VSSSTNSRVSRTTRKVEACGTAGQARDAGEIDCLDHKHTNHLDYKHSIDNRNRSYDHHPVRIPSLRIDQWQRRDEDTESVGDGELG